MTRYSSCDLFAERARVLGIATPDGATLAERYTKACEDAIAACPAVPGAYEFIDWLRARDVDCFVVSGTPQQDARHHRSDWINGALCQRVRFADEET